MHGNQQSNESDTDTSPMDPVVSGQSQHVPHIQTGGTFDSSNLSKRGGAKAVVLGLAALVALTAASGGVYAWQHAKVTQLSKQVATLSREVESLKEQAKEQSPNSEVSMLEDLNVKARDTERQTDINTLMSHLEAFYAGAGYYPSLADLNDSAWRASNMRGLDHEALLDPSSSASDGVLVTTPVAKAYAYAVVGENNVSCEADDTKCAQYTLTATLETTVNGSGIYVKKSL